MQLRKEMGALLPCKRKMLSLHPILWWSLMQCRVVLLVYWLTPRHPMSTFKPRLAFLWFGLGCISLFKKQARLDAAWVTSLMASGPEIHLWLCPLPWALLTDVPQAKWFDRIRPWGCCVSPLSQPLNHLLKKLQFAAEARVASEDSVAFVLYSSWIRAVCSTVASWPWQRLTQQDQRSSGKASTAV